MFSSLAAEAKLTARCWAEISADNLRRNLAEVRAEIPADCRICAVVKANAYGHGAAYVAKVALAAGATYLAVATPEEALALRRAGIQADILILAESPIQDCDLLIREHLTQTIASYEEGLAFQERAYRLGARLKVHLKIDTGMARLGFSAREADFERSLALILAMKDFPNLDFEGIFTHFADAGNPDISYTRLQFERFQRLLTALAEQGFTFRLRHCANSASLLIKELPLALDMVRAGIVMYGGCDGAWSQCAERLHPVMALKSRITLIHDLPPGETVSYGRTFRTERPSRLAVIEIGYADGLSRGLSNRLQVAVRGRLAPVAGSICMDRCMIDITDIPEAQIGDVVTLFGDESIPGTRVDDLAPLLQTIPYELWTRVSDRVPRLQKEGDELAFAGVLEQLQRLDEA